MGYTSRLMIIDTKVKSNPMPVLGNILKEDRHNIVLRWTFFAN